MEDLWGKLLNAIGKRTAGIKRNGLSAVLFGACVWAYEKDLVDIAVLLFFGSVVSKLVLWSVEEGHDESHPRTQVSPVLRSEWVRAITEELTSGKTAVTLVTGMSGGGKSLLVAQVIASMRIHGYDCREPVKYYGYNRINEELAAVRCSPPDKKCLIVLDQLEKVFLLPMDLRQQVIGLLDDVISECRGRADSKCILVIRKESYLNLRDLKSPIPLPSDCHVVPGLMEKFERTAWEGFREYIENILSGATDKEDLRDRIIDECARTQDDTMNGGPAHSGTTLHQGAKGRTLLPVKAEAVARALVMRCAAEGKSPSIAEYERKGGLRKASLAMFQNHLPPTRDGIDAARILGALSVDPRSDRALSKNDIAWITDIDADRVGVILDGLTAIGLVDRVGTADVYDWTHDYYAEEYARVGGWFLDAMDRDNISAFWQQAKARRAGAWAGVEGNGTGAAVEGRIEATGTGDGRLGLVCFWAQMLVLSAALLRPWIVQKTGMNEFPLGRSKLFDVSWLQGTNIEVSFVPIVVSVGVWAWYVYQFNRQILTRVGEKGWASVLSGAFVVVTAVIACLAVVETRWWILCVGIGGLVVGLKYRQLGAKMETPRWMAKFGFKSMGLSTIVASGIAAIGGWIYGRNSDGMNEVDKMRLAAVVMVAMLAWAMNSARLHILAEDVPVRIGTIRRYMAKKSG